MTSSEVPAPQRGVLGPVSYLIVEFPGNKMTGEAFPQLVNLVDRGLIRILDLEFVRRERDGSTSMMELADIDHDGKFDIAIFEGSNSGILDQTDFDDAAAAIEPGSSAAIMIFENHWALPFVQALRRGSAQVVAAGYIPQDDLAEALDATEH
jgi:hypothetical protein